MSREQETSLPYLQNQQNILEKKTASAQEVLDHLETPGWIEEHAPKAVKLSLAEQDPLEWARNLTRVGKIKGRLREVIPGYQESLQELSGQIAKTKQLTEYYSLREEIAKQVESGNLSSQHLDRINQIIDQREAEVSGTTVVKLEAIGQVAVGPKITAETGRSPWLKRIREKESLELPTGAIVDNISPLTKACIENLLKGNAEKPISSLELMQSLWKTELSQGTVTIEQLNDRLSVLLSQVRKRLAEQGIEIVNTTPKSNQTRGEYYIRFPQPKDTGEKPPERIHKLVINNEEKTITVGGETIKVGGRIKWELINLLARDANKEVSAGVVKRLLDTLESKSHPGLAIRGIREIIEEDPSNPQIITTTGPTHHAFFRLNAQVEYTGRQEIKKAPEIVTPTPKIPETEHQIILPDNQIVTVIRIKLKRALEELLKTNQGNTVSSTDIARQVFQEEIAGGMGIKEAQFKLARDKVISDAREILAQYGWGIINTVAPIEGAKKGKYAEYYLTPTEVVAPPKEAVGVQKPKRQIKEVILPNGQTLTTSLHQSHVAELLLHASKNSPISKDDIAKTVYREEIAQGLPVTEAVERVEKTIYRLRFKLARAGAVLENSSKLGEIASYYLEYSNPVDVKTAEDQEILQQIDEARRVAPLPEEPAEFIEVPVELTREEILSADEKKLLSYLNSKILTRRPDKPVGISFEELQKTLYSQERIKLKPSGGQQLEVLHTRELIDMLNRALVKIRKEARLHDSRSWDQQESKLWDDLQKCVKEWGRDDLDIYRRKVQLMIANAEKAFYHSLPENEQGRRIYTIDI